MIGARLLRLYCGCLTAVLLSTPVAAETPDEVLARAAERYRALPLLAERLDYTVRFPDGREESKAIEYGRAEGRLFMAMIDATGRRVFHLAAGKEGLRALQFNIGGGYVETPFDGSLTAALVAVGGDRIGLTVPPGLAAHEPTAGAFVEAFGFGVLPAVRPATVETRDGVSAVGLTAESGSAVVKIDAETGQLVGLVLTVGQEGSSVRLDGTFRSIDVPAEDPRWHVPIADRRPTATFAELEAKGYPLGEAAPDIEVQALGGEVVSLASLQGRVVVLDFWATWCVPCWTALEHLERVAEWAESSGMPVSIWAVDTGEQTTTFAEQARLVSEFLSGRQLELPVLVDVDDSFFAAMHSPGLPSTVILAPDGTLAQYHSGVGDDMEEVLKAEVVALLEDR